MSATARPPPLKLQQCLNQLLGASAPGPAKPWLDQLVDYMAHIVEIERYPDMFLDDAATITEHGKAVSMITAAQCADDTERSRVFMKGIFQAIEERLKTSEKVHLLYAGTGPFGMLVIPILCFFEPARLQVTLIDIHQESIEKLHLLIQHLELGDYVNAIERADATTWRPPDGHSFDLIVSETMKHLLQQEPQVWIFSHLEQFLTPTGSLIPQAVTLSASLTDNTNPFSEDRTETMVGTFFELNRATAAGIRTGNTALLSRRLTVPPWAHACNHLKLATYIRVYQSHQLDEYQSQLTLPKFQHDACLRAGSTLKCEYLMGQAPDWNFTFKSDKINLRELASTNELSSLGIAHLKRLWERTQNNKQNILNKSEGEWSKDKLLLESLCPSLHEGLSALYQSASPESFEQWMMCINGENWPPQCINTLNRQLLNQNAN